MLTHLEIESPEQNDSIEELLSKIELTISERLRLAKERLDKLQQASVLLTELKQQEVVKTETAALIEKDTSLQKFKEQLLSSADDRRKTGRAIARAAMKTRTSIVRRVFNSSLNKVWRDLFVRLAPSEPYVPAFKLPEKEAEQIGAHLETIHRDGGSGGTPGAMLSSGNLNTAALTLFLALHLVAKPLINCIILDDPVQSMDEVHIAQFAALLRTLSKEHGRQIVMAVHERPLFEYLCLELSPSFPGDQLIAVELSRSDGATVAEPNFFSWNADRAVAA